MDFNNQFKNNFLTQGNSWGLWYNILLFNTPFEKLSQIKQSLKNNPEKSISSCVVHIDKPTLLTLDHAVRVLESAKKSDFFNPEYIVYSSYINTAITKAFMESGCIEEGTDGLTISKLNNYLKSFSSTNPKSISDNPMTMLPICFIFNDFVKKEELNIIAEDTLPKELQKQINSLIARRDLHIKFWTTKDNLSTYKTSVDNFIEVTHDYIIFDVKENILPTSEIEKQ